MIPKVGRYLSLILDRLILVLYGLDLESSSVNIKMLSISHPSGVLLGGNGIVSNGRVAIMAGVKFVGRSPNDPLYLDRHRTKDVFMLGDNVVIGAGSTVIGPVSICDNVMIGAMSLVNRNINESGLYVGIPLKKISDNISYDWVEDI
ncbi:hypothetical protein [Polynucleobacter asymbioticus]|uniref:hypothetical protein n=1 Tax=Polynucleobacter asymbioticus TaxID=576611 RepID=UPI0015CF96F0|nr:hypothetical protein [Polynucleobacter asymbioticus]